MSLYIENLYYYNLLPINPLIRWKDFSSIILPHKINSLTYFLYPFKTQLLNKTIYLTVSVNLLTELQLSDSDTLIKLQNNKMIIQNIKSPDCSTPIFNVINGIVTLICTISPTLVELYSFNKQLEEIPKSSNYLNYTEKKELALSVSNSILYNIDIFDSIHSYTRMETMVKNIHNNYNI
jgi:hypothetical protein